MKTNKLNYIENLYNKAYYCRASLDKETSFFHGVQEETAAENYKSFLQEKLKNPVAATIAMRDEVRVRPISNIDDFTANRVKLEQKPEIKKLIAQLAAQEINYPGTSYIRQELIAKERVNLHTVTPKLTGIKKLAFKLKLLLF